MLKIVFDEDSGIETTSSVGLLQRLSPLSITYLYYTSVELRTCDKDAVVFKCDAGQSGFRTVSSSALQLAGVAGAPSYYEHDCSL